MIGRYESATKKYYHKDHLGSTRAVVGSSGTILEAYDYYPFGLQMPGRVLTGTTKEQFTGQERDTETNLDYFGARCYMSALGRWTSVDPLAEKHPEWSPYNYVLGNPLYYIDPDGRQIVANTGIINFANTLRNVQAIAGDRQAQGSLKHDVKQTARIAVEIAADTYGDVFELATSRTVTGSAVIRHGEN